MIWFDGYKECPPISDEWAKFLASWVWGMKLDFDNMNIFRTSSQTYAEIKQLKEAKIKVLIYKPDATLEKSEFLDHKVWLQNVEDPYNRERHLLGYEPITNTLVIGGQGSGKRQQ